MEPPLWPSASPSDDELLRADSWGPLFDRWTYTVRCFLHRLLFDSAGEERLTAHRLVLHAARFSGTPGYEGFWPVLRQEILIFLADHVQEVMAWRAEQRPELLPLVEGMARLPERMRILVLLYDYEHAADDRSSHHDEGRFRPRDLARLFDKSEGAVRTEASRALALLRELHQPDDRWPAADDPRRD